MSMSLDGLFENMMHVCDQVYFKCNKDIQDIHHGLLK